MESFTLPAIPAPLQWHKKPQSWSIGENDSLLITAGVTTDWFVDPKGNTLQNNAPVALFSPTDGDFILKTKVKVGFEATFDAGVLMVYAHDTLWAKLCFEFSPQGQPMIVSVVTKEISDDCNSVVVEGNEVYLRVSRIGRTIAFHYSFDGAVWNMVRYFSLGEQSQLKAGFLAQAPTGEQCDVIFSEVDYQQQTLKDIRSGE